MSKDRAFMTIAKVFYDLNSEFVEYMQDTFDLQYYHENENPGPQGVIDRMKDSVVCVVAVSKIPREAIAVAPALKLINVCGAGYNNVDVEAATQQGVPVANGRGGNANSVVELTIAHMINISRRITHGDSAMRADIWTPHFGTELRGKVLGVVGMGAIGSRLAQVAKLGFDMRILAYDVFRNPDVERDFGVQYVELSELFSQSDYITVHAPLTSDTEGMIDLDMLKCMKPTAYIFNMARGGIISEQALREALDGGFIAGAGLDVFASENEGKRPIGEGNWFKDQKNLVLTPHTGGMTRESAINICRMAMENVQDVMAGRRPRHNVVNPEIYA